MNCLERAPRAAGRPSVAGGQPPGSSTSYTWLRHPIVGVQAGVHRLKYKTPLPTSDCDRIWPVKRVV